MVKEIIVNWDEHRININELCARLGYRPDYLLHVGLTNAYAKKMQDIFGKNEITTATIGSYLAKMFGLCVSPESCDSRQQDWYPGSDADKAQLGCQIKDKEPGANDGEINMMKRLTFVPIPVAHVLRDGKKYLLDFKDIVVGDVVFLDAKISGIIPADIILCETSPDFNISAYTDTFDKANRYLYDFRKEGYQLPLTATRKSASYTPATPTPPDQIPLARPTYAEACEFPEFILDSPNFVPMGGRLYCGSGKGICIRIGNKSLKATLR